MGKAVSVLRVIAIVLNVLFLALLVLLCIQGPPEGVANIIMATIIFIAVLSNILILIIYKRLLAAARGTVISSMSVAFGILMLLILVFAISQSGFPEPPAVRLFVLIWFLTSIFTSPAVLMLRANAKKKEKCTHTKEETKTISQAEYAEFQQFLEWKKNNPDSLPR